VRREALADGWIEDRADVHLRLRSGETAMVRAEDTWAAEALLSALGLDGRKRVLRVELSSPTSLRSAAILAGRSGG
jgi:hypothetical protein